MTRKMPVEHFIHGKESWKDGFWGFLNRGRGVALTLVLNLMAGGFVTYIQFFSNLEESHPRLPDFFFAAYVIVTLSALALVLYFLRRGALRAATLRAHLHAVCHAVREIISKAECNARHKDSLSRNDAVNFLKVEFGNNICNQIREYFRVALNNSNVECALRICNRLDNQSGTDLYYCTIGRSLGLDQKRSDSCHVPVSKGIPNFFLSLEEGNKCMGVLAYHDIEEAASAQAYYMTENDKNFSGEINALLVAPVNGFDGEKTSMLGLLYITSTKDIFGRKNVDSIGAIADVLGIAFSRIIPCLFARKTILIKEGIGRGRT